MERAFTWPLPSHGQPLPRRPLSKWERGECQLVGGDIDASSTRFNVHSYPSNTPNIPHAGMSYDPLGLPAPLQQSHHGSASYPLQTLEYPPFGQVPAVRAFPTTNVPPSGWQQGNNLAQNREDSHSQRQEQGLTYPSLSMDVTVGPQAEVTMTGPLNEPVDELEMQVTDSSAR
jgi:hypothetical protein